MALKVTKADEIIEVKTLCTTIYSQPGLGKTSLAFTASNPLLFDFDKGAHRAANRKDVVQVGVWADVASITKDDISEYDTIILDTVGKALDSLAADIIKENSRLATGGALNQRGWGTLGVRFSAFLRKIRGYGKDVILISHMDEKADGDVIKERLKIQGGTKDLVTTDSDVMARISISNKERQLVFNPTETNLGKDPARLDFVTIPDIDKPEYRDFMAGILAQIKEKMNELSEDQIARKGEVEWFETHLPEIMTPEDINAVLGRAKSAGRDVQLLVVKRAEELGLEYDSETQGYVYLEEMADSPEEEKEDA